MAMKGNKKQAETLNDVIQRFPHSVIQVEIYRPQKNGQSQLIEKVIIPPMWERAKKAQKGITQPNSDQK